jgi:AraC-like DNA-binding protein
LIFKWITKEDLKNFNDFCDKVSNKMKEILKGKIDETKQELFEIIYSSSGTMTVKELSESVYWSSRQINRYFKKQFGMSLKPIVLFYVLKFRFNI